MTTEPRPEIHNDRPRICPVCRAPFPGFAPFWDHAESEHDWTWRGGRLCPPESELIGMARSALYVLGVWATPRVHRGTVAAVAGVNRTTSASSKSNFLRTLRRAERNGYIERDGDWINVLDHEALYVQAVDRIESPAHAKFLALDAAVPIVTAQIASERNAETRAKREGELEAIKALMRPYRGPMTSDRRPVRVVAHGRAS